MYDNEFTEWVLKNLGGCLPDIREHGCSAGFPGITYFKETMELYDEYQDDIWHMLNEYADECGYDSALGLLDSRSIDGHYALANAMVWAAVELVAHDAEVEEEEEDDD
jgi:hypothetical protein